jgi:hypothetical protein
MASILKKQNLGVLIETFQKENITPDLVCKLSVSELNSLGVLNRSDMMKLRIECSKHGILAPQRSKLLMFDVVPQSLIFPSPCWSVTWKRHLQLKTLHLCCPCQKVRFIVE